MNEEWESLSPEDWQWLLKRAKREVDATLKALPAALKERAQSAAITYDSLPDDAMVEDGIEPDTLGLFVGDAWPDENLAGQPLPPQIILFLENLWDQAEGDEALYAEEIRRTLLHELGHYLGLDELDLEGRGLE
jgi:predicted Zn-dependent protease with MMP-like domain